MQSKNIDFIQANHFVDNAKRELKRLRSDIKFEELIERANNFSKDHNLSESHFKESRYRKTVRMSGEHSRDEISSSASHR